jgi:hypothetical protein
MSAYVHTTAGGRRFHDDPDCRALVAGQSANSDGSSYAGTGYLIGVYPPVPVAVTDAVAEGRTACRVCMTASLTLPATGETYGHEPLTGTGWYGRGEIVCARCTEPIPLWLPRSRRRPVSVHWPCMSAVVLGLAPRPQAVTV